MDFIRETLSTLPNFIAYILVGGGLQGLFFLIYLWITPYRELALIRDGNTAAALSLGGAMIGFTLPLASVISHAVSLVDTALWSIVALAVQIGAYVVARFVIPEFGKAIPEGKIAPAVLKAAFAISFGMLNAACLTY
jgi:putative membrane protein